MTTGVGGSQRIAGLDGLRALSVLSVVLTHFGAFVGLEQWAVYPLIHGTAGVRAFFVLSGFLISGLLLREFQDTGEINYLNFLKRRALRIFPLYILFLLVMSSLYLTGVWKTNPDGLAYSWLYVYNFIPPRLYDPLLAHTWSLAVEEHFYLLWPLCMVGLLRRKLSLIWFIVGTAALSFLSMIVFTRWLGLHGFFLERWTPVAAFSLLAGCLAAVIQHQHRAAAAFFARWWSVAFAALLFVLPAIVRLVPPLAERVLPAYVAVSLQAVGIATYLLWLVQHQRGFAAAVLEWPPLKYIGTISYGIYIWQGFFLGVSPDREAGALWPPSPIVGVIGIAIVAPLSYHFFEKPFLAIKGRFSAKSPAVSVNAGG
jgi:peptidoglycan/LPS O-acetylase OafA/YrhL